MVGRTLAPLTWGASASRRSWLLPLADTNVKRSPWDHAKLRDLRGFLLIQNLESGIRPQRTFRSHLRSYFFGFAFLAGFADLPVEDLPAPADGAVSIHGFVLMDFGVIFVEVVFLGISISLAIGQQFRRFEQRQSESFRSESDSCPLRNYAIAPRSIKALYNASPRGVPRPVQALQCSPAS